MISPKETAGTRAYAVDVVVPIFNEAEGINRFHEELTATLRGLAARYSWTVTYVVDPSTDGTAELVRDIASRDPRVRAVLLLRRAGHQMSLIAGMEQSNADAVITMDGDLQHPPQLIPRMLELFESGVDVVQTVRVATVRQGLLKRRASRSFYRLISRLSEVPITSGGADFRLLSARAVRVLCHEIRESDRFIRGLVPWLGLPTATLDFVAPARAAGESKYTFRRSIGLASSGILGFSKLPLYIGIVLGLVVSAIGLLSGVIALGLKLGGASIPAGWTTLVVMVALLSGVQLVTTGLIGLYLGVVFDEAKRRPGILVAEYVSYASGGTNAARSGWPSAPRSQFVGSSNDLRLSTAGTDVWGPE